jgi:hypothetical protein
MGLPIWFKCTKFTYRIRHQDPRLPPTLMCSSQGYLPSTSINLIIFQKPKLHFMQLWHENKILQLNIVMLTSPYPTPKKINTWQKCTHTHTHTHTQINYMWWICPWDILVFFLGYEFKTSTYCLNSNPFVTLTIQPTCFLFW